MSSNDPPEVELTTRRSIGALVLTALWVGLADALSAFFWDRVAGTTPDLWLRDLAIVAGLGALSTAAFLIAATAVLFGIARLVQAAPEIRDRLLSPLAPVCVYIAARPALSDCALVWKIAAAVAGAGALVSLVLVSRRHASTALSRGLAVAAALSVPTVAWFSIGALARARFSTELVLGALAAGAVPAVLTAVGWAIFARNRRLVRVGITAGTVVAAGLWIASQAPPSRAKAGEDRPSVLFVVVDTLRADSLWGSAGAMPKMRELAATGTYYPRAYTPIPKTQQSVSSFHTGMFPWHTGVRTLHTLLDWSFDTMAEKFERAGYRTVAFVHNPWIDYGMGHEQGFHEYFDHGKLESIAPLLHSTVAVAFLDRTIGRKLGASRFQTNGRVLTDAIVSWLETEGDEGPFFMWVQYFDPHWPYLPPPDEVEYSPKDAELAQPCNELGQGHVGRGNMILHLEEKTDITKEQVEAARRLYRMESWYDDKLISEVLATFDEGDEPIFLLTADHGESLGEHNYHFHHGEFTYDTCLHVPMFLSWPGKIERGAVVNDPVMTTDILATLTHLAGVEAGKTDGVVFPGVSGGPSAPKSRPIPFEGDARTYEMNDRIPIAGVRGKWRGVMIDGVKVIAVPYPDGFRYQVYDLASDPGEVDNLYTGNPKDIERYLEEMRRVGLSVGGGAESDVVEPGSLDDLSQTEKDRLRALGYMQ